MGFELSLFHGEFNNSLVQKQAVDDVMKYNEVTARYGLILTQNQAIALVETRSAALKEVGRVEFGGGIIDKIIYAFCDCAYMSQQNYEETLHELIEIFYYYKNETLDLMSDNELIQYMRDSFENVCQGSLELLAGRELDVLARNLQMGRNADYSEDMDDIEDLNDLDGPGDDEIREKEHEND